MGLHLYLSGGKVSSQLNHFGGYNKCNTLWIILILFGIKIVNITFAQFELGI